MLIVLWVLIILLIVIVIPLLSYFSNSVWLTLIVLGCLAIAVAGSIIGAYRSSEKKIPWFAWLILAVGILHILAGLVIVIVESIKKQQSTDLKLTINRPNRNLVIST